MGNVRAINGFDIRIIGTEKYNEILIQYKINGEFFIQSKYKNINEKKIREINDLLEDYTHVNLEAEELCRTIPMTTMINAVEDIVFERK